MLFLSHVAPYEVKFTKMKLIMDRIFVTNLLDFIVNKFWIKNKLIRTRFWMNAKRKVRISDQIKIFSGI
jgi:uncharacterized membrane protein